jgi:transglutaminase-like putative cysteine protease
MIRYSVVHETQYTYDSSVTLSQQMLHMRPREFEIQRCEMNRITIRPTPSEQFERLDYFGNTSNYFAILVPHKTLTVLSESSVTLIARPVMQKLQHSPAWETVKQTLQREPVQHMQAIAYRFSSPNVPCNEQLVAYAMPSFWAGRPLIEATFDLTQRIFKEFEFDPDATDVSTPLNEVLAGRRGVCQDFAHLMIGCLRSIGLACRYVSGYILTTPPEGKPRLVGADASHAWVSVYCPVYGWVDFDPTNNCLVQNEHITAAWGRDFSDVSPMRGVVLGGGKQHLKVSVTVTPLVEVYS